MSNTLWDADPTVCCAAFQLGACVHTEGDQPTDDYWPAAYLTPALQLLDLVQHIGYSEGAHLALDQDCSLCHVPWSVCDCPF
jgi:hypothetical protein